VRDARGVSCLAVLARRMPRGRSSRRGPRAREEGFGRYEVKRCFVKSWSTSGDA
jgi:hypothetical protein